jgi:YYY domain-containing protein
MTDLLSFFSWWFLVTLFGIVAWPILFRVLRFLPDRGYSLAKTGGLLAVGYTGWLLGNFGFVQVNAGGVLVALLLVAVLSLYCLWGQTESLRDWLRQNRMTVIAVELLFILAFGAWAYARALNPSITATEKPMEFAFLNSVLRTGTQPPGDPWLSGYAISYYHFGYVLMGMLTALSGVQPSVAFNLGIALLFGLTASGAFGVVLNLIAYASGRWTGDVSEATQQRQTRWLTAAILPALLAPVFVLLGNFNGAVEVAHKTGFLAATPEEQQKLISCPVDNRYCVECSAAYVETCGNTDYASNFWGWLDIKWTNNPPGIPVANENGDTGWVPDRFLWWWQSSRVIHDRNLFGDEVEVIDEFPFFSFLLGDMHPHVLGLPFVFLALGYALNIFGLVQAGGAKPIGAIEASSWLERVRAWVPLAWPDLLIGAVVLGGLSFLNTWDFPIYAFVVAAAYWVSRAAREGWSNNLWRDSALVGASLIVLGALLYLPFYIGFRSQLGGLLPNVVFGTRVQQFAVMFGPWLTLLLAILVWVSIKYRSRFSWGSGWLTGASVLLALILVCVVLAASVVFIASYYSSQPDLDQRAMQTLQSAQAAIDAMIGQSSLSEAVGMILRRRLEIERLLTPVLLASLLAVTTAFLFGLGPKASVRDAGGGTHVDRAETDEAALGALPFMFVLIVTGALLTLGPEFVYLRDLFSTRMNTVFKFYYQAWVVWSLASAFGVWFVLRQAKPLGQALMASAAGVVVMLGLIYPILATGTITDHWQGTTRNAEDQPYPTLDGMAYMQRVRASDLDAIKFLNATVTGRPVIAEAVGGSYTEYGRVSVHTGLPTVLGWPFHELQWRGTGDSFAGREEDIRQLYTSNDWAQTQDILNKYHIRYVYVGQMELSQYEAVAFEKFDRNLSKIYENNGVIIYEYRGG